MLLESLIIVSCGVSSGVSCTKAVEAWGSHTGYTQKIEEYTKTLIEKSNILVKMLGGLASTAANRRLEINVSNVKLEANANSSKVSYNINF